MKQIKYRSLKKYKYQLWEDYKVKTPIKGYRCFTPFIALFKNGKLIIKQGYSWDGPSGPTIDTHTFMRGSLVHDVFYQLMRSDCVLLTERDKIDRLLQAHCIEDGMSGIRAWWVYRGVKYFAQPFAQVAAPPEIYTAPHGNKFHNK